MIRETDADAIRLAKTLVRGARYGALAVLEPGSGSPLASRVAVATDLDGTPLILVSMLSAHTGAILADPRCSLLLGEPGKGDPLAHPRISLGLPGAAAAARIERERPAPSGAISIAIPRRNFMRASAISPSSASISERASLNGGFGKAYLLDRGRTGR